MTIFTRILVSAFCLMNFGFLAAACKDLERYKQEVAGYTKDASALESEVNDLNKTLSLGGLDQFQRQEYLTSRFYRESELASTRLALKEAQERLMACLQQQ